VVVLVLSLIFSPIAVQGQEGLRSKQAIYEDVKNTQWLSLTLHRQLVDANGHVTGKSEALNVTNPDLKFSTGDRAILSYKASVDSYIYIVNASPDGTTLMFPPSEAANSLISANTVRDITFRLEGTPGREDFIVVVSRAKIDNPDLKALLSLPTNQPRVLPSSPSPLPEIPVSAGAPSPGREKPHPAAPSTTASNPENQRCGFKCVVKNIGHTVGGIALNMFTPWLGSYFSSAATTKFGAPENRFKTAVFESASDNNEIFAIAEPTSDGKAKFDERPMVLRLSLHHVGR
jgi:hypothetical protein